MKPFTLPSYFRLVATLVLTMMSSSAALAFQTDDWINADQPYWKFKVAEEGIYKLTFQDLQRVTDQDLASMNPEYFQLYRLGEEEPLHTELGGDGSFDQGDYMTFYGEKNDGTIDTGLYTDPDAMANPYQSLYTDSAAYFLTWAEGEAGQRYQTESYTNYSQYQPKQYFMDTVIRSFEESYNSGDQRNNDISLLELSYYTQGEGWTSNFSASYNIVERNVKTPEPYKGSNAPPPQVQAKLIGTSKCNKKDGSIPEYDHRSRILVNNNVVDTYNYNGYNSITVDRKLKTALNSSITTFNLWNIGRIKNQINLECDKSKIAYIKVIYPRSLKINKESSLNLEKNTDKVYLPLAGSFSTDVHIYDKFSQTRLTTSINDGKVKSLIPPKSQGHRIFVTSKGAIETVRPEKVRFKERTTSQFKNTDYLIITNKKLRTSAQQYAQFRKVESNYNTELVYVSNLFNRYSYGQHHALGIRYFLEDIVNNGIEPDYLLLIGKGLQPNKLRKGNLISNDLVPTMGQPPTDNLFVKNLDDSGPKPSLTFPVGRIPASTNQEVNNYLNKVKEYRKGLVNGSNEGDNRAWRKQFLHISGGTSDEESERYKRYLEDYEKIAENSKLGVETDIITKSQSIPTDKSQKEFVVNAINEGRGLVTYFGHGAAEVLEVDIGDPKDYTQKKGNYPIFLFSGCIIGNSYTQGTSMPENFLVKDKDNGGVAWMAESAFSFTSYLDRYTTDFYQSFTNEQYGSTLGEIFKTTASRFKSSGSGRDYINEMQILQKTLHGDPALELFAPENPDYTTSRDLISFKPEQPNSSLDSFTLSIVVKNLGKFLKKDSLSINVEQQLSDLSTVSYAPKKVSAPANTDTFEFSISVDEQKFKGNNRFKVSLNNRKSITELDSSNNSAQVSTFFPSSGITVIRPAQYSIVNSQKVQLKVQANNLFLTDAKYQFQIDTVPSFNSPAKQTSPIINGDQFGSWKVKLSQKDSTAFYWRAKKVLPDETDWVQKSFVYIDGSEKGWAQGHFDQFRRSRAESLSFLESPFPQLSFDREALGRYNIQTTGAERGRNNTGDYFIRYEGPRLFYGGADPGMYVLAVNENTPKRLNYKSSYNIPNNRATGDGTPSDTSSGVFHFNWVRGKNQIDTSVVNDFITHITDSIPNGYQVFAFTARRHLIPEMPEQFYEAMAKIGGSKVKDIKAEWPYILIGEKGFSPGEATEITADTTQPVPPKNQLIKASKTIFPLQKQGTITSTAIGPSRHWEDVFLKTASLEATSGDSVAYDVIGLDRQNNEEEVLKQGLRPGAHALSDIDQDQYPYLKIRAHLADEETLTPPQLNTWLVHYDYLPEGSFMTQTAFSFNKDTLERGEKLDYRIAFQNISDYPMDSLKVVAKVLNQANRAVIADTQHYRSLAVGDTLMLSDTFSTGELAGSGRLKVVVNPEKAQPERYLFNNIFTRDFHVETDRTAPALDVTFNGRYIKDNAVLNPQPFIKIQARDNNNYYFMKDTSRIDVRLTYPNGSEKNLQYGTQLDFSPATVKNDNKAIVRYKPESPLATGQYKLSVEAADATGNVAAGQAFEKRFRVMEKTAIVDFHAAPNPFADRTRFQFRLKGAQVPDEMRIAVFSVQGDRVRTIRHDELAPLRMGENKTDYLWNGRNAEGQSLSPGVYFYKVKAFVDGEPVPYQITDDRAGQHDRTGKLILVR